MGHQEKEKGDCYKMTIRKKDWAAHWPIRAIQALVIAYALVMWIWIDIFESRVATAYIP